MLTQLLNKQIKQPRLKLMESFLRQINLSVGIWVFDDLRIEKF